MKVLYISYDGMTDNLGASQVIPYLRALAQTGFKITILSCEKPERAARTEQVRKTLAAAGISWFPIAYHKRPPVLSSLYDIFNLIRAAHKIFHEQGFSLVHCRSYLPSLVGLHLKHKYGVRFLFDMRGFWADERVDGGLWKLRNPLYAAIYNFFKRKESAFLREADAVVSLTQAGKQEMLQWPALLGDSKAHEKIRVIPCCVDLEHFDPRTVSDARKREWRQRLNLTEQDTVLVYLGSLGTWYMLREMLLLFRAARSHTERLRFLIITPESPALVWRCAAALGVAADGLRVVAADREEIPVLLSLSQLGICFIKPSYSKISSSATKLAEFLAMGVPVIANAGVGDQRQMFTGTNLGYLLEDFSEPSLAAAAAQIPALLRLDREKIRQAAVVDFSLAEGAARYHAIYQSLGAGN